MFKRKRDSAFILQLSTSCVCIIKKQPTRPHTLVANMTFKCIM